jgi:hypothetical protein
MSSDYASDKNPRDNRDSGNHNGETNGDSRNGRSKALGDMPVWAAVLVAVVVVALDYAALREGLLDQNTFATVVAGAFAFLGAHGLSFLSGTIQAAVQEAVARHAAVSIGAMQGVKSEVRQAVQVPVSDALARISDVRADLQRNTDLTEEIHSRLPNPAIPKGRR